MAKPFRQPDPLLSKKKAFQASSALLKVGGWERWNTITLLRKPNQNGRLFQAWRRNRKSKGASEERFTFFQG